MGVVEAMAINHHHREDHRVACGHTEQGNHHNHREDHRAACEHTEQGNHHHREDHRVACGHTEHGCPNGGSEGHGNHHHREDHRVACGHTEHGRPNGSSEGHGYHHRKDQSTGTAGKHGEFNIESRGDDPRSVAARGRVSKAAERRGLAIENTLIQEALRAPSSSLPMAAPESRSGRITRSMA